MLKASKHEAGSKIRSRQRAVADYDVDRPQVQAWRHVQPSGTNCPGRSGAPKRSERNKKKKGKEKFERKLVKVVYLQLPLCGAKFPTLLR